MQAAKQVPLPRTRDPLLSSASAKHFILPSGATFIVRSPPSSLPPNYKLPSSTPSPTPDPFTSHQPFLATASHEHLLPPSHPTPTPTSTVLSPTEIASLQALRRENPVFWTRSKLAAKFGVAPTVVARLGWGEGKEGREAERARKAAVEEESQHKRESWGWKKAVAREERTRRRAMW